MPGFTERERDALTKAFKEIGDEAEAQCDGRTILPFTKAMRQVLVHSLLAATDAAVESAKTYTKELHDERARMNERRASLNAHRLTELENCLRKLEQKAN